MLDLYNNDIYKRHGVLVADQMATGGQPEKYFKIIISKGEEE